RSLALPPAAHMLSALDLFTIGIGPSSSHTVGPMRAARRFVEALADHQLTPQVARVTCETYGSLAATGKGHGTDRAIILGLLGHDPESIDVDRIGEYLQLDGGLKLPGGNSVPFDPNRDLD